MTYNSSLQKNHWCVLGCVAMLATSLVVPGVPQTLGAQASGAQTTDEEDKRKASDLSDRLIRGATNASDEDVMATIVRLMGKASEKLSIELDPGAETQDIQRRIADQLDEAIKTAAAQRRMSRQRQQTSRSDKRRRTAKKQQGATKKQSASAESGKAETPGQATGGAPSGGATGGDLQERRRMWGNLPEREREEVLQGIGEQYLEQYKEWIERYYRALQEAEERR